ncbi:MAG: hypothetical protein QG634_428 [Patescibacteria group bacterium]|nr:hypothetical protein [Patescibacteria group bacterium]
MGQDKDLISKIKAFSLGEHAEETAIAAIQTGKASKQFTGKNGKDSKFYIHICKTKNVMKIHKKTSIHGIEMSDTNEEFSLSA